jgi:neutral ceramidase
VGDSPLLPYLAGDIESVSLNFPGPTARQPLPFVEGLLVGAAEVDITPPPGMPKDGHSKNSQDGRGFRTRLRARAIHLRSGRVSLALVAADVHSGSSVVRRLVARALEESTDIPLSGIFLGSTHTHAGPGQFHSCDFYNRWASNRPGFDPAYTHFLVQRLAAAAQIAFATRRPGRLATGATQVWGFTRNRSLAAYVRNDNISDMRTEPHRKYTSINPWLHMLRVDAASPSGGLDPLAALAIFSVHGTGISRHDPSYNADVWAYVTGEMAHRIEAHTGASVICGAVEGAHGDTTPAVRLGMLVFPEAERVGRGIGEEAAALHKKLEASLSSDVPLGFAYQEIDLDRRPCFGGLTLPDPAVGAAKLAGAVENTTPFVSRIPPFRAGYPKPPTLAHQEQGAKWVVGGSRVQYRLNPVSKFPRVLPVQLLVLGSMAVMALPFEVTVEAGRRLEATLLEVLGRNAGVDRVAVSSTANDYWDYLTTPEEYGAQYYEGASTLHGPNSHPFVTAVAASLAARLRPGATVEVGVEGRDFRLEARRYFASPSAGDVCVLRSVHPNPVFVEATATEDAYWEVRWLDVPPGDLAWDEPLVAVERLEESGRWVPAVDDQGWRIGVTHEAKPGRGSRSHGYAARWFDPPLGRPGKHRFVLLANANRPERISSPFD